MDDTQTNYWKYKYCTMPIKGKHSETIAERLERMGYGKGNKNLPDKQISL